LCPLAPDLAELRNKQIAAHNLAQRLKEIAAAVPVKTTPIRVKTELLPWEEMRRQQEERINMDEVKVSHEARTRFTASLPKSQKYPRSRSLGSGAFPLEGFYGVGGHFHSSVSQLVDGRSRIYPIEQDKARVVEWNGSHIDHTKLPYVFEDTKWCSLSAAEKDRAFTTYPNERDPALHTLLTRKVEVSNECMNVLGPWKEWKEYEHRSDIPERYGRFGRKVFDAQVGERRVGNTCGEIETRHGP